ncbi:MAG: glycerol-3-phosphate dehydrogenase/oxidase [Limnohabitans sp.]|nr:glycerol-3-phosphate dehydrogenase/oxidase [Limnohabitans sp.]
MKRAELLSTLGTHPTYDLVVVGGGATGLGVALDAVLRGFSVLLLESHDFAGGTSSRSTKLLHGGVRYLAQGNIALVREALAERAAVLKLAPHLAQPLPFVMPSYKWWQTPFYGLGLKLYDVLAGKAGLGQTEWLSAQETLAALPGLQSRGLKGGVKYWDGQFDDARLALALARTIERAGGQLLNYMNVARVHGLPAVLADGARFELSLTDQRQAGAYRVFARSVVNAAGVWVDAVRQQSLLDSGQAMPERIVSASQGVHLVVSRDFMPGRHALLVPKTQDGRVLFAVPWMGALILGTTDTPRQDLPREPQAFEAELEFILSEASKVLSRPVTRSDVQSMWVGLRPLVGSNQVKAGTKSLSREHTIVTDDNGLITVTGGKWTTYRSMAEDVMQACFEAGVLPRQEGQSSHSHVLFGALANRNGLAVCDPPGWHLYGSQEAEVRACPGAEHELGLGLTEAMVRYAARHEYAWTVEDVLARRWRALFLDARQAMAMAPEVARILTEETGQGAHLTDFMALSQKYH